MDYAQRSMAGGELAPAMYVRADQSKYPIGLKECYNFIVRKHGGLTNRTGSEKITGRKYDDKIVNLIKFVFNTSQTYAIEVGHLHIRIIKAGVPVTVSADPYNGAFPYTIGDTMFYAGSYWYCIADHSGFAPPNATYWYEMPSDGTLEIPSTYDESDLMNVLTSQSGDVINLTHQSYPPKELRRYSDTKWAFVNKSFSPSVDAPSSVASTAGVAGALTYRYVVVAVKAETLEKSVASATGTVVCGVPTTANPNILSWVLPAQPCSEIMVFREVQPSTGRYGYIGSSEGTYVNFRDTGITPDADNAPPTARTPFSSYYPACSAYYQQRMIFGSRGDSVESVYASRTGYYSNFTVSSPSQSDDSVTFAIAGNEVNQVRHMVELGRLLVLTSGGEWSIEGDSAGVLKPGEVNPRNHSKNGIGDVPPLVVSSTLLYVQARGSIVRSLGYDAAADGYRGGYRGDDLSVYSSHLFEGHTILAWDYQQVPDSVVWAVRDDGIMLGFTFIKEHSLWAWHRHETDGIYEDVCVVPEGQNDVVYVSVARTVNGVTKRYTERFKERFFDSLGDSFFVDCGSSYDGTNTGATTLAVSGGTNWTFDEVLTLTASPALFSASDVDNEFWLRGSGGVEVKFTVTAYSSPTVVSVTPNITVPVSLRGVAVTDWSKAVDELSNLDHLALEPVSVLADASVVSNGHDDNALVVSAAGTLTLDKPAVLIHVGRPYKSRMRTLDIDPYSEAQTIMGKSKLNTHVTAYFEDTYGAKIGTSLSRMRSVPSRTMAEGYGGLAEKPVIPVDVTVAGEISPSTNVYIQQDNPMPCTILAAISSGG